MKPTDKLTEMALFGQDAETRQDAIQLALWMAGKLGLDATAGHVKIAETRRVVDGQKQVQYKVLVTAQGLFHLAAQRRISLEVMSKELTESMAIVTIKATAPNGQSVTAIGVADFDRFRRYKDSDSSAVANALMAADTKAKARAIRAMLSAPLSDVEAEGAGMTPAPVVPAEVVEQFYKISSIDELINYVKTSAYPVYRDSIKPLARAAALRIRDEFGEVIPENFAKWLGI